MKLSDNEIHQLTRRRISDPDAIASAWAARGRRKARTVGSSSSPPITRPVARSGCATTTTRWRPDLNCWAGW